MNPQQLLQKRITWKNDAPASEKQLAFAHDLLRGIQAQMSPFSAIEGDERKFVWRVWNAASVPDNLTKIEATHLIDFLRNSRHYQMPSGLDVEVLRRLEGASLQASPALVFANVCSASAIVMLNMLNERAPETVSSALSVRAERIAKAQKN